MDRNELFTLLYPGGGRKTSLQIKLTLCLTLNKSGENHHWVGTSRKQLKVRVWDLEMSADVGQQLPVPPETVRSSFRPEQAPQCNTQHCLHCVDFNMICNTSCFVYFFRGWGGGYLTGFVFITKICIGKSKFPETFVRDVTFIAVYITCKTKRREKLLHLQWKGNPFIFTGHAWLHWLCIMPE